MYLMKKNEFIFRYIPSRTIFTKLTIEVLIGILISVSRHVIYKHLIA